MELTLKGLNRKGTQALYAGAFATISIKLANFADKTAPQTLLIDDAVLVKPVREAKVKLTKEQRAALPKPTLAERVARAEKRAAELKAKLDAANAL